MLVFFSALIFITLWQFLPEFVFPFLQSMAFLCWVAPENTVANFIGSGSGGMGFMNLSFDWSTIGTTYNLFLTPWWTQVIIFVAFVANCWILIPAAKWGNLGSYNHGLMTNRLLRGNCFLRNAHSGHQNNLYSRKWHEVSYHHTIRFRQIIKSDCIRREWTDLCWHPTSMGNVL
jgi:hypothetical protein